MSSEVEPVAHEIVATTYKAAGIEASQRDLFANMHKLQVLAYSIGNLDAAATAAAASMLDEN